MSVTRSQTFCSVATRRLNAVKPHLRVLLFSPRAGRDPLSGDTTYTDVLLHDPPPGVIYTPYDEALADGSVRIRGRRPRHGRITASDLLILAARVPEHGLRGRAMYREPWWFVSIDEQAFDLVHSHLFSLRQVGSRIPILTSAGFPLSQLYSTRERWSAARCRRADAWERRLAKALRVEVPGYHATRHNLMAVYTETYRLWLMERGQPEPSIRLTHQALPDDAPMRPGPDRAHPVVGFIGRDFLRKGGWEAAAAVDLLRVRNQHLGWVVVTTAGRDADAVEADGASVMRDVPRMDVVEKVLPDVDVLLAPTSADCGTPYGVLEALRAGCAVVLTPNPWLDPRLSMQPGVYYAQGTEQVAQATETALADLRSGVLSRESIHAAWADTYSLTGYHQHLLELYEAALRLADRSPT